MISEWIQRPGIRQLVRFCIVGFANTAVDWAIFFSLTSWSPWFADRPLIANALAFAGGFTNSYIFNRIWTFRSTDARRLRQASKFLIIALIGLALSEVIIAVMLPLTDSRLVSKFVAVVVVLGWNFIGGKFWAFRA